MLKKQYVIIGRKKYAIGIFWQPRTLGLSSRNYAKKLSKLDKEYNLFIEYKGLIGLTSNKVGHKKGMPSLAVQFIKASPELNSFLAVFEIQSSFWVVALRNNIILSDKVFINEIAAKEWFNELLKIPDWNSIIAPSLWNIQKAGEKEIKDFLLPKANITLKKIEINTFFYVVLLFVILFFSIFLFKDKLQKYFSDKKIIFVNNEKENLINEENQITEEDKDNFDFPEIDDIDTQLTMPYSELENLEDMANLCYKGIGFVMQPIFGFRQTVAECYNYNVSVNFIKENGNIRNFYNEVLKIMPGVLINEMSETNISVSAKMPFLEKYNIHDLSKIEDVELEVKSLFQNINIPININVITETITNGFKKEEIPVINLELETKLTPISISKILKNIKPIKLSKVIWNNESRIWNYEVKIYVK